MAEEIKIIKGKSALVSHLGLPQDYNISAMPDKVETKIKKAKSKERSDIPTYLWNKNKYAESSCLEEILQQYSSETLERINVDEVSTEEFRTRFEYPKVPCIIQNVVSKWAQIYDWSWKVG